MRNFYVLSFSQLVSGLGSNITIFAIGLWVFKKKGGSITDMALIHFINEIPRLMISPLAGIITDRGNRKAIMVVCDFVAALMTAFIGYSRDTLVYFSFSFTDITSMRTSWKSGTFMCAILSLR
jgi:MFS family permease